MISACVTNDTAADISTEPTADPDATMETTSLSTESASSEYISDIAFICENDNYSAEIPCWLDTESNCYYVFLPSYALLESTRIVSANNITLNDISYKNSDTIESLNLNTEYKIKCYNQDGSVADKGTIIFMKGENIATMYIETESGELDSILADKDYKEEGSMILINEDGSLEYEGGLDYIKGRGNYTWMLEKRPFNIKLEESADLLGMGSAKRWCLLANYTDQSLIRNKIVYDFANEAGMQTAIDSEFIDLYINGEYYGLFQITEKVEVNENRVEITDLEEATEAVNIDSLETFEAFDILSAKDHPLKKGLLIENNPDDITGGYLVEVDLNYRYEVESSGFVTDDYVYCVIKNPEYSSAEQVDYISELFNEMEQAITSDSDTEYLNYIDLDSWVHAYIISEIFENYDTMGSSQYFYKDVDTEDETAKIYAGPLWDFDMSMGNIEYVRNPSTLFAANITWFKDLYDKESFYSRVQELYSSVYLPLLNELLETGLDELEEKLTSSADMNYVRWPLPESETNWYRLAIEDYSENIEYLDDYLSLRTEFLTDIWINDELYYSLSIVDTYDSPYYYSIKSGESIGSLDDPEIEGYIFEYWVYYGTRTAFDLSTPITEDTQIAAYQTRVADISEDYLDSLGYSLSTSPDLFIYLKLLEYSDYTVFIAANDEATNQLDDEDILEELSELGLETNLSGQTGISYLAVIKDGDIIIESSGFEVLTSSGTLDNGASYELSSAGVSYGSYATIILDGTDYAVNGRGLNIVVYDEETATVVDSVCFDTYWGLSTYSR